MRYAPRVRTPCFLFATALALAATSSDAAACAPAPPEGGIVRVADEEALIAWNAETGTEHFVRRASFRSSTDAFGFIVPTPSKPELGEVPAQVFDELAVHLRPQIVWRTSGWDVNAGCTLMADKGMAPSAVEVASAPSVRVLAEQSVAGYDAVVLAADDPAALAAWLGEKGFAKGPALTEWLAPYVSKRWILTAFKIQSKEPGREGARALGTSAVRMTFETDRPFYPYREPSDQRETLQAAHAALTVPQRTLRIYFASDVRYAGALGDGGTFPGKTELAASVVSPASLRELLPERTYLTVFDDRSTPRLGTDDVFFSRAADPSDVSIPPVVVTRPREIFIPVDLAAVALFVTGGAFIFVRRARRRRHPTQPG
jgi:hypothetical protein